jgi:lactoylglutathione lyase
VTSDRVGRLVFIALQVRDLDASTHFYRDVLGVPLSIGDNEDALDDRWIGGGHQEHSWREGAYLHFALFPATGGRQPSEHTQLGFAVDDLRAVHRRVVAAGVNVLHGPGDEPWGMTARYSDPDGNVVGLTQLSGSRD